MATMEYGMWNFHATNLWSTASLAAFNGATIAPIAAALPIGASSGAAYAIAAPNNITTTDNNNDVNSVGSDSSNSSSDANQNSTDKNRNADNIQISADVNLISSDADPVSEDANQDSSSVNNIESQHTQTDLTLTSDLSNACDDNAVDAVDAIDNHFKLESQIGFLAQQYAPVYNFVLGHFACGGQNMQTTSESDESSNDEDSSINAFQKINESSMTKSSSKQLLNTTASIVEQATTSLEESSAQQTDHKCPVAGCDYRATNIDVLEKHVTKHGEKTNKGGKKNSTMQRIRYEREEYRCTLCTYTCTTEKAYVRHLRLHSMGGTMVRGRVSCAVCGRDRNDEAAMAKHMRKHRDDRFFCCDICVFRTVQLKKLIQHRRMHTGEKPHLCPHCAYRSARRDNLRSHVRRVHKRDNLLCDTFSPRGMLLAPSVRPSGETTTAPPPTETENNQPSSLTATSKSEAGETQCIDTASLSPDEDNSN